MKYRKFGRLDWNVSVLGFGAMRLPTVGEDMANVDEAETTRMVRYAIDHGVNYVDTAYFYHMGNSERVLGKVLRDGYREKIRLATKLPARIVESAEDFDRFFDLQLERLGMDRVDFYLLHGLNGQTWARMRDLGVLDWAERQMARGRIGDLGFSFHDEFDAFKQIVDGYDNWVLSQVQYNFMDVDAQAGRRGVEYAANRGLAVVVMEPLRGGKLAKPEPPAPVARVWAGAPEKMRPVEWGLRWVWDQPEISVALSGMSTMDQVVENVAIADRSAANSLTPEELALYDRAREAYRSLIPIPCTGCHYCMPCPNGVEIQRIFEIYNDAVMYEDMKMGQFVYCSPFGPQENERADKCIECDDCLEKCPQHIQIPDWLKKVHEALMPGKQA